MDNYKTIGEVSEQLNIPTHVLRFWETKFKQIKPVKRRGNRRFYSESDVETIENIRILLHIKGLTIKGAQKELTAKNQGFLVKLSSRKEEPIKGEKPKNVSVRKIEKILTKLKKAHELLEDA